MNRENPKEILERRETLLETRDDFNRQARIAAKPFVDKAKEVTDKLRQVSIEYAKTKYGCDIGDKVTYGAKTGIVKQFIPDEYGNCSLVECVLLNKDGVIGKRTFRVYSNCTVEWRELTAKCPHCGETFRTKENRIGDQVTCGMDDCPKPNEPWPILEEDQPK